MRRVHSLTSFGALFVLVACSSTSVTNNNNTGGSEVGGTTSAAGGNGGLSSTMAGTSNAGGTLAATSAGGMNATAGSSGTEVAGSAATGGDTANAGAASIGGATSNAVGGATQGGYATTAGGTAAATGGVSTTISTAGGTTTTVLPTGGSPAAGGSGVGGAPTGGITSTAVAGTGGKATGGAAAAGGAATGGKASTGGAATGGAATGGAATGGKAATGGAATGGAPGDTTQPTVTKVSPTSGATGVTSDALVAITFSEAMDQASVRTATTVSGFLSSNLTFSWNAAGTVLTITPTGGLAYNSGTDPGSTTARSYTVAVSAAATDLAGNSLASAFSSSFTTLRQITQTFAAKAAAHYYEYGLAVSGGNIEVCATNSETYNIGYTVTISTAGGNFGLAEFALTLPTDIAGVSGATLTVQQSTPTNNYYTGGGTVQLDELAYQAIAATGMSWLSSATIAHAYGTLSAAYSTNSTLDITTQMISEIGAGQRSFLYRFGGINGANNAYAVYYCGPVTLALKYLTP